MFSTEVACEARMTEANETNIAIQEQVDTLNAERKKMGEEYNGHKAAIDQKTADKNTALSTFQSDCWSKSAEARTLFDEAIKGKKKAALFAQEILAITPVAHDVEDLKTLYISFAASMSAGSNNA